MFPAAFLRLFSQPSSPFLLVPPRIFLGRKVTFLFSLHTVPELATPPPAIQGDLHTGPDPSIQVVGREGSGPASLVMSPSLAGGRAAGSFPTETTTSVIQTRQPPHQQAGSGTRTCGDDLSDDSPNHLADDLANHPADDFRCLRRRKQLKTSLTRTQCALGRARHSHGGVRL